MSGSVALTCPWCGMVTFAEVVWSQKRKYGDTVHHTWPSVIPDSHECEAS